MGTAISELGLGIIALLAMVGGTWMVRRSVKTGESVTPWPLGPVRREKNPILCWFDLSSYSLVIALGGFAGFKLLS
jgi:hypothetical protein